jgi:hypothetical protein
MAKVKEKTTFTADDGREFKTREEAERYEIIRQANEKFNGATRDYNLAIADVLKTADGYPFELGRDYYIVWEHLHDDGVTQEWLRARDTRVVLDGCRVPTIFWQSERAGDGNVRELYLANIYKNERNAHLRLLERRKERLGWLQADIAKLEERLGIKPDAA